ncbi:hypothetical protein [Paenibacillus graminis]|uniref:hypothetical protein n=1 Tax=Paenibacillus graminis TaxID=189425 RepID=UPI002DB919B7|nr:hypothetical protein [Paenibacillus graminis]MEC0169375.1 hypothetical protein [Paenibacillus graminis]
MHIVNEQQGSLMGLLLVVCSTFRPGSAEYNGHIYHPIRLASRTSPNKGIYTFVFTVSAAQAESKGIYTFVFTASAAQAGFKGIYTFVWAASAT